MSFTSTTRLAIRHPDLAQAADFSVILANLANDVDSKAAGFYAPGLLSARPAAGVGGMFYFATDNGILYYDNGTTWSTTTPGSGSITSAMLAAGVGAKDFGTAFPTSGLFNGYRFTLAVSGKLWDFMYRADLSGSHPWFFVGGTSINDETITGGSTTSLSNVGGGSFNIPAFAGNWAIDINLKTMAGGQVSAPTCMVDMFIAGSNVFSSSSYSGPAGGSQYTTRYRWDGSLAASATIAGQFRSSNSSSDAVSWNGAQVFVTPINL